MLLATAAEDLRTQVDGWRCQGQRVALVPTMGNLHAGHLSLLTEARRHGQRVVASLFVNPTQFGPGEDYARYPRTLDRDRELLAEHGCDLLFAPPVEVMYPFGVAQAVRVHVPGLSEVLEGANRPGHFDGVCTVVARLFHLVGPDLAVFGQKDYQQWRVIERMVRDLSFPLRVIAAPTVRAADGLALSSRNQYLSADERALAPQLHATLQRVRDLLRAGSGWREAEDAGQRRLRELGFEPDYVAVRRGVDLTQPASGQEAGLVVLAAAHLGATRLLDNLVLDEA